MFPFEDLSLVLLIVSYAQLEVEPQEQEVLVVEPQELEEQPQQLDVEQEHQAFMAASSSSTISRISKVSTSKVTVSSYLRLPVFGGHFYAPYTLCRAFFFVF